jgi:phosphatidylserine decarboxylase
MIIIISITIFVLLLVFFRGVNFHFEPRHDILYAPCEGNIKQIQEYTDKVHITIFLNIHNVHVQYAPCDCIVKSIKYVPGQFNKAYILEKSKYNERMEYILKNERLGDFKFIQIAGQVARRIKSFVKEGQQLTALEPLGLIKFGSRCDLVIPKKNIELLVKKGQHVNIGDPMVKIL